jgi:folate-binding protein YgfZ
MPTETVRIATRPRDYVRVRGPDAADYLERMLSNEVAGLAVGAACEALLLTPKARVIAPLVVLRRAGDDFLLLTERELGERVVRELRRSRFAARAEIELEEHSSVVAFGTGLDGIPTRDYGAPAVEVLDRDVPGDEVSAEELELMRIRAKTPRYGREIDDRVLPAEAGLVDRAVSFTKGCYPGQEPVARLHHRGHANRGLRVLELDSREPPPYDAEVGLDGKTVGRVTSVARALDGRLYALAYVRVEVPAEATLAVDGSAARSLD